MKKITTEEAKTICKFYDRSDKDALEYLVYFCKNEDIKQLFKLAQNAQMLDMYNIYSTMTADDYQQQKWELFNKYGFYMKQDGGMYYKENKKEKEETNMPTKTWEEFNKKYNNRLRDFLTVEEEREFVRDIFTCYENDGVNDIFWTPFQEQKKHNGKKFTVMNRLSERECDLEALPMWLILFEDGETIHAYPEEIITSEMKKVGCPEKYLNKKENNNMIKTWEEFNKEYEGEEREIMSQKREREYVNDFANCLEEEGFNEVFWSPFDNEGETQYYGKSFKVIGRTSEDRNNLRILPLWDIEFEDGKQLTVEPCEIFTNAMKDCGCPEKYLINEKENNRKEETNTLYERLMMKLRCEMFSYKETLYRMNVDEVIEEAYKLTMLKEFVIIFETQSKETLNAEQFNFFLRMDNALEYLYDVWLGYDSNEKEIYADFLFKNWNWEM